MTSHSTSVPGAHTPTRRNLLKVVPLTAAVLAAPACARGANPDAALIAAWERRVQACGALDAIPQHASPTVISAQERRLCAIIDAAETEIEAATALTPRGAEIQLWTALDHGICEDNQGRMLGWRGLQALGERPTDLDWDVRLVVAALRSLKAQGAV